MLEPKTSVNLNANSHDQSLNPFPPGCGDIIFLPLSYQYQPTWKDLIVLLEDLDREDLNKLILRAAASYNGKLYGK